MHFFLFMRLRAYTNKEIDTLITIYSCFIVLVSVAHVVFMRVFNDFFF